MFKKQIIVAAAAVGAMMTMAACSSSAGGDTAPASGGSTGDTTGATGEVKFRLWDDQAAAAYEEALPAFEEKNPGVKVNIEVIPWADYWTGLRNDIASGETPDVFWTNSSNYADYAAAGKLLNIDETFSQDERAGWLADAVDQYTVDGTLWGVPAITDPGIGVFYNKDILDAAGLTVADIENLEWNPDADTDSLREVATKLTLDSAGKTPADEGFDPKTTKQFGYNASLDIQATILSFLGSGGAEFQNAEGQLNYDTPEGQAAFQYITDLINKDYVAPSAADTNDNGDFNRDQFLQGNLALFQTGAYNLSNVLEAASFEWGIVGLPKGPAGAISVGNSIVAAGSADAANPEAQKALLAWIAGPEGSGALGKAGVALPANTEAQGLWTEYWAGQKVDVAPLIDVLKNGTSTAPFGPNIQGAMEAQQPALKEMLLGRLPVPEALKEGQAAANKVVDEN